MKQNFEIAAGLNPVQSEIEDDRVLKLLKKYRNVRYNLTPPEILFPASVKNDTEQIFIACRDLNDVKNVLINRNSYGLLGIIDLNKINNWEEIKGQPLWIKATLEEQKETNNSGHICFSFTALTQNDLLNFSINLIGDNNKHVEFKDNETKISILNFKLMCFWDEQKN